MKNQNQRRRPKGGTFFVGLFLAVCLMSGVYAEVESQENDLFGVLENDLLSEMDSGEPNMVIDNDVVLKDDMAVTKIVRPVSSISENDLLIAGSPTTPIQRQLWKARIGVSKESEMNQARNQLEEIIRQINAIEIKPQVKAPEPTVIVETAAGSEPNEMISEMDLSQEQGVDESKNKTMDGLISDQTLQRFKDLSQEPDALTNPLALAEILFKSGYLAEAAVCYQVALNRTNGQKADSSRDKAWIYLQLGNCLKDENSQAALENYEAVIAEFPYSPWARVAKAKGDLIRWYLKDQPKTLIDESKS